MPRGDTRVGLLARFPGYVGAGKGPLAGRKGHINIDRRCVKTGILRPNWSAEVDDRRNCLAIA